MSATLIAIDPGSRQSGAAVFRGGRLCWAAVTTPDHIASQIGHLADIDEIVIEIPQVYSAGKGKGDPNDLVGIAIMVGRWLQLFCGARARQTRPRPWKGQAPKPVIQRWAYRTLSVHERLIWNDVRKGKADVYDAVALGLWHLQRVRYR